MQGNQQIFELLYGDFFGGPCGRRKHQNHENPTKPFHFLSFCNKALQPFDGEIPLPVMFFSAISR